MFQIGKHIVLYCIRIQIIDIMIFQFQNNFPFVLNLNLMANEEAGLAQVSNP